MYVLLTEKGLADYASQNLKYAINYISAAQIPDFGIDIGPLALNFIDMKITEADIPAPFVVIDKSQNAGEFEIDDIQFGLTFQFSV